MGDFFKSAAILASIHPKWCKRIFEGSKTVEIRKSMPKLNPPFTVYIYCTLPDRKSMHRSGCIVISTDDLFRLPDGRLKHDWSGELMTCPEGTWGKNNFLNGKVIGKAVCDRIDPIHVFPDGAVQNWMYAEAEKSGLSYEEVAAYIGAGKTGYAWRLKNPVLFDEPRPIQTFHRPCPYPLFCESCGMFNVHPDPGFCGNAALQLKRPPQSWLYVDYVL